MKVITLFSIGMFVCGLKGKLITGCVDSYALAHVSLSTRQWRKIIIFS